MSSDVPDHELEKWDVELKAKIDAALAEADAGLIAPLDIEAIKAELRAKLDQHGKPRATTDH